MNRLWLALIVLLVAAPVHAQAASFDEHVAQGQRLYLERDYAGAIAELEAAYALRPVTRLLFNLGMAHRKLGHARTALSFFERYREQRKAIDAQVPIDRYIDELRAQLAIEERAAVAPHAAVAPPSEPAAPSQPAAPASPPPVAPARAALAPTLVPSGAASPPARALPLITAAEPPRARRIWKKWWFWTATVVGAAAIATAVGVGVTQSQANETSFVVHAR